jgi:hypothetical protein
MFQSTRGQGLLALTAGLATGVPQTLAVDATKVLVHSLGPVHIKPHLSVAERYDDNIFYRASRTNFFSPFPREDDFITVVSPGVNLQVGRKDANYLLFDYQFDQLFYLQNDQQNSGDHTLALNSKLAWKRVSVEGTDRVQFLAGILGGSQNLGQKVDRIAYFDNYRIEYALGEKTAVYVEGQFDAVDYERGTPLYDSNTLRGTGGFGYLATPKIRVFGELYYGQSAIDPNRPFDTNDVISIKGPHQDFFGGFLGVRGDFTSRLTGRAKGGYEVRQASDGTPAPSSPVVEVSLEQRFSEKTAAVLSYFRRHSVSVQAARLSYTADAVSAHLNQVLGSSGKLVGTIGGSFENDAYEPIEGGFDRHDLWYRLSAGLTYNIQLWLTAGLSYEFERYRSNQVIDYDVNRVSLRISVGY